MLLLTPYTLHQPAILNLVLPKQRFVTVELPLINQCCCGIIWSLFKIPQFWSLLTFYSCDHIFDCFRYRCCSIFPLLVIHQLGLFGRLDLVDVVVRHRKICLNVFFWQRLCNFWNTNGSVVSVRSLGNLRPHSTIILEFILFGVAWHRLTCVFLAATKVL